jgi:ferredoxin
MCEAEAPDVFEVGDDGSLQILDESPGEEKRAELEAAVEACPTEALSIAED